MVKVMWRKEGGRLESDADAGDGGGILLWRRIIRRVLFNGKHCHSSLVSGARLSPVFAAVTWLFPPAIRIR